MIGKLLVLCLVVQVAHAVIKMQLNRPESLNEKLIREGKLDEYRISQRISRARMLTRNRANRFAVKRQPFYDFNDLEYNGKITIGSADQEFSVILDTGSSNLWIVDKTCNDTNNCDPECQEFGALCGLVCDPSCCGSAMFSVKKHQKFDDNDGPCEGKTQFDSDASNSYVYNGESWAIQYGTGSASGFLGQDTVKLGDKGSDQLVIPKVTFGQATSLADFFTGQPLDGILGLAFRSLAEDDVKPVFQEAIDQKLVDNPYFTVWIQKDGSDSEGKNGGQITWGGLDSDHCDVKNIVYIPLESKTYWEFSIQATQIGKKKRSSKYWTGISDTGTSFTYVPTQVMQDIVDETNAQINEDYGAYEVDCKTKFTWTVTLNGNGFTIDEKSGVLNWNGVCLLAFGPQDDDPQFILDKFKFKLTLLILFFLRDSFIREHCQIYDMTGQVGFTKVL
ncbi:Aspartic protease [Aphelenchoides bicaudatus]|nr:Aspartic protease [Aphelenchoides bicaudatus]